MIPRVTSFPMKLSWIAILFKVLKGFFKPKKGLPVSPYYPPPSIPSRASLPEGYTTLPNFIMGVDPANEPSDHFSGSVGQIVTCPVCHGSGNTSCMQCAGKGIVLKMLKSKIGKVEEN